MIFKSIFLSGGSGSAGGLCVSRNKGGYYVKSKASPINPNSARQQATRTQLADYASNWTLLLTDVQRAMWNSYSQSHTIKNALGEDIYINGINWYIMFNTRLADASLTAIAVPPPGAAPIGFTTCSGDVSALDTLDVTFTPAVPAGHVIQLWQTLPCTQGSTPNFNQTRLVGYSGAAQASPWAATLPFTVNVDEQITCFARLMNPDGQVSVFSTFSDIADYI
jgi:hypothetical protein